MSTKIALFTPFQPTMGGGGQNLRGAIPHLKDVEVTWCYLAHKEVSFPNSLYLGTPVFGGGYIQSALTFLNLTLQSSQTPKSIQKVVEKLLELEVDSYWVVAHYEGCAVAEALLRAGKRVHISVHDDPVALFGRSRRYFWGSGIALQQLGRILQQAKSIDCTSVAMARRYETLWGVKSITYYPYVEKLPDATPTPATGPFRVGYAGSLYSPKEPRIFAEALALLQKRINRPVEWHFWGLNAQQSSWIKNMAVPTFLHPFAPEAEIIPQLQPFHLLYVMYPFESRSAIFRQTSHPAKLSTYLKIQRPHFAHTPSPSSLADYVLENNLGIVSDSQNPATLASLLHTLLTAGVPANAYTRAHERWYGNENLERLRQALLKS